MDRGLLLFMGRKERRMDVECTLNTYDRNGIGEAIIKVQNSLFDGKKVRITLKTKDGANISVNVVGDELIAATQKCMLTWNGR